MIEMRDYLKDTYLSRCRKTLGLKYLSRGKSAYRLDISAQIYTDLSPKEIFADHDYILKEGCPYDSKTIVIFQGFP